MLTTNDEKKKFAQIYDDAAAAAKADFVAKYGSEALRQTSPSLRRIGSFPPEDHLLVRVPGP